MPLGTGYGQVPQGRVGTGTAQVFDSSQVVNTMKFIMGEVKKDHQQAQLQKRLDKKAQKDALTWSSKGFENDINTWLGGRRREAEEYYISEKAAGRDPDDISSESGRKFQNMWQTTEEDALISDQFKTTYNTAVNSTDERFHDVDASKELHAQFRLADKKGKMKILEENPDLLVEKPFDLLDATQMVAKDSIGMITRPDGNFSLDPNSGLLVQGVTTEPQEQALETAAYEMMREPDVIKALEDRGYGTAEEQHEYLSQLLANGKDIKKKDLARTPPSDPGKGLEFNFNSGGYSNEKFNFTIEKLDYGQAKTQGKTGVGQEGFRVDVENASNTDIGAGSWDIGQGVEDVNIKGKLLTIEHNRNGELVARIRSEQEYYGGAKKLIDPTTGKKYSIEKGDVVTIPYSIIDQQFKTKFKGSVGADEMITGWQGFNNGGAGAGEVEINWEEM